MPINKKTHEEIRMIFCFFCLRKGETKSDKTLSAYETRLIIENFMPNFENFKDFLPLGCCGSCRRNLSYRFGKNASTEKYKPFPCETEEQYYQNIIEKLRKLPRGSGDNKECKCFMCEPAHVILKSVKVSSGRPKEEFSNQKSRYNRTLDQSRVEEVTELMEKMTPKAKDAFVYARM